MEINKAFQWFNSGMSGLSANSRLRSFGRYGQKVDETLTFIRGMKRVFQCWLNVAPPNVWDLIISALWSNGRLTVGLENVQY